MSDHDLYFRYSNRFFIIYMLIGVVLRLSIESDVGSLLSDCLYYLICKICIDSSIFGLHKLDKCADQSLDTSAVMCTRGMG